MDVLKISIRELLGAGGERRSNFLNYCVSLRPNTRRWCIGDQVLVRGFISPAVLERLIDENRVLRDGRIADEDGLPYTTPDGRSCYLVGGFGCEGTRFAATCPAHTSFAMAIWGWTHDYRPPPPPYSPRLSLPPEALIARDAAQPSTEQTSAVEAANGSREWEQWNRHGPSAQERQIIEGSLEWERWNREGPSPNTASNT